MVKQLYKRKPTFSPEAKRIILECALFFLALFLTPVRFIFDTHPFGFILCASAKKDAPFAFVGALFSCIFFVPDKGVYIIAFISLFILRTLVAFLKKPEKKERERFGTRFPHLIGELFCENIFLRVLISLACAFGVGIYYTVLGGYMLYDIFALVFFVTVCPLLTYLASGLWEGEIQKSFYIGLAIIGFMIAFGLRGRELGGFDFSVFLSFALVFYISKTASPVWGAVLGALLSTSVEPRFALSLIICALVSGILFHLSTFLAILCAVILGISYSIWAGGYDAFTYIVPELVGAAVLVFPILQLELIPFVKIRTVSAERGVDFGKETELDEIKRASHDTSRAFYDVSKILHATHAEAKNVTLEAFQKDARRSMLKSCAACPKEEICWSRDTDTTERAFRSISESAYFLGTACENGALDEKFVHRCPSFDKISEQTVELSRANLENGIKNDKLEVSACALELAAKVISELGVMDERFEKNESLSKKAEKALIKGGVCFEKAEVLGTKSLRVIISGIDTVRSKIPILKISEVLGGALDVIFDEPTLEEKGEIPCALLCALPNHKTSYSKRSISKEAESNGDTLCAFGGGERSYYLICDGMGTGHGAHITSSMCASFLEAILPVTRETKACLSVINSFVRAKGGELSSTVDLLEIDNFTGAASFYKSGACASLIKRGERVFSITSKTAPVGIMKRLDCEMLSFTFESGDIAVMISDGALSGKGDFSYIEALLKETDACEPSALSEQIVNEFLKNGEQTDDLSVLVISFE